MKRMSCLRLILIALVVMSAVACTDNVVTPKFTGGPSTDPQNRSLVASQWHQGGGPGLFVSSFGNITGMSSSSNFTYTVYVLSPENNDAKTLISRGPIDFKGGRLWAETVQGNLSIYFRGDSNTMPFTTLELTVVY